MRSESFIVARSTIRAPFYNRALTVCQGFTAAQPWRKSNGVVIFRAARRDAIRRLAETEGLRNCWQEQKVRDREDAIANTRGRVRSPDIACGLRKWRGSATYAFQFLTFTCMPNYCSLLGCAATLSFTVALAAQPTPATKPAIPAHSIEAAPKAVPAKVEKEAARKDSSSAQGTGNHV